MKDFKYFTENSIQHISLHDCCCKMYWDCGSLVFEMEWMEIFVSHPNNQFNKAH